MKEWRRFLIVPVVVALGIIGYLLTSKADRIGAESDLILLNNSSENVEIRINGRLLGESRTKSFSRWPRALGSEYDVLEAYSVTGEITAISLEHGIVLEGSALVVVIPPVRLVRQ